MLRKGKSSVECQWEESKVYSVGGREVKCTVLREGKSGVHCQGMGSHEYSVRGREVKCTV